MKTSLLSLIVVFLFSCGQQNSKSETTTEKTAKIKRVIQVEQNPIMSSFEQDWYSRKYLFYTSRLNISNEIAIGIKEHKNDSSLTMNISHKAPVLYEDMLLKIREFIPTIEEHFDLSKLTYISLQPPTYYIDLNTEWTAAYAKEFGRKNEKYDERQRILESVSFTAKLNTILSPYNKKLRGYLIEKFHLIDKKHYHKHLTKPANPYSYKHFNEVDYSDYPAFLIDGLSFGIVLEAR